MNKESDGMNTKKIRAMAAVSLAFLIIVYVCFYLVNKQAVSFRNKGITTETALYGEISDSIQTQGFAVREETIIDQTYSGVLNYRVANGSKVSQGGLIADIFLQESDAAAQNRIDRIDREIQSLEGLAQPIDYYASTSAAMGEQIFDSLCGILTNIQRSNFSGAAELKENLLLLLSRKQVMAGEESSQDYAQRVTELQAEKNQLSAGAGQAVDTIEAPQAGYFISSTDGFESVVDVNDVKSIMPDELENLLAMEQGGGAQSSVGKICSDFKWYLVCIFDDVSMIKFEGVEEVSLDIPFASTETIPAKVIAKNRDPKTEKTAVVLECSYMDADIATIRNETVQVNVKNYKGVLVNEKALRFCNVEYNETDENGNQVTKVRENVKGVYVVYGGQLEFVQVITVKDVNGYAVCKTELSDSELESMVTRRTVQLYDEIVVGGVDLYDGKIVK